MVSLLLLFFSSNLCWIQMFSFMTITNAANLLSTERLYNDILRVERCYSNSIISRPAGRPAGCILAHLVSRDAVIDAAVWREHWPFQSVRRRYCINLHHPRVQSAAPSRGPFDRVALAPDSAQFPGSPARAGAHFPRSSRDLAINPGDSARPDLIARGLLSRSPDCFPILPSAAPHRQATRTD